MTAAPPRSICSPIKGQRRYAPPSRHRPMPRRERDGRFHRIFTARHHSPSMSVFSQDVGNVKGATLSGRSPADELYFKWMIAAAVFFVVLQIAFLGLAGLPPTDQ